MEAVFNYLWHLTAFGMMTVFISLVCVIFLLLFMPKNLKALDFFMKGLVIPGSMVVGVSGILYWFLKLVL